MGDKFYVANTQPSSPLSHKSNTRCIHYSLYRISCLIRALYKLSVDIQTHICPNEKVQDPFDSIESCKCAATQESISGLDSGVCTPQSISNKDIDTFDVCQILDVLYPSILDTWILDKLSDLKDPDFRIPYKDLKKQYNDVEIPYHDVEMSYNAINDKKCDSIRDISTLPLAQTNLSQNDPSQDDTFQHSMYPLTYYYGCVLETKDTTVTNGQKCVDNKTVPGFISINSSWRDFIPDNRYALNEYNIHPNDATCCSGVDTPHGVDTPTTLQVSSDVTPHGGDNATCGDVTIDLFKIFKTPCISPKLFQYISGRIYIDGVFDMVHAGHFNALRQASELGRSLVVGINSDQETFEAKGSYPIYTQEERAEIIRACKWVDEVVIGTPYDVSIDVLNHLGCVYTVHGDDLAIGANGFDAYAQPRIDNRLKIIPRTEGISTTTLISRLLSLNNTSTPQHNTFQASDWKVLMSSHRLFDFIGKSKKPKPTDRVVYVDGSFDVFHVGHVRVLERAKALGDYLIVGIHADDTVAKEKGPGFPIINIFERALAVLAMRTVDEVILGAPWPVPKFLIQKFNIFKVVRGVKVDTSDIEPLNVPLEDPYRIPKEMGIYVEVESHSNWTTYELVKRLRENEEQLRNSVVIRANKEAKHWKSKV